MLRCLSKTSTMTDILFLKAHILSFGGTLEISPKEDMFKLRKSRHASYEDAFNRFSKNHKQDELVNRLKDVIDENCRLRGRIQSHPNVNGW